MAADLTTLATEIKAHLTEAGAFARKTLESFRQAGLLLLEAKKQVYLANGKRGWKPWLKENGLKSVPQCEKYIRLAQHWNALVDDAADLTDFTTLTEALARIDAATGKPTKGDQNAHEENGEANGHEQGTDGPDGQPAGTEAVEDTGRRRGTSNRLGNNDYLPRFDGDAWRVVVERTEAGTMVHLPLRHGEDELFPRLHLGTAEAQHLITLLSQLV